MGFKKYSVSPLVMNVDERSDLVRQAREKIDQVLSLAKEVPHQEGEQDEENKNKSEPR